MARFDLLKQIKHLTRNGSNISVENAPRSTKRDNTHRPNQPNALAVNHRPVAEASKHNSLPWPLVSSTKLDSHE
eukprot:scaffold159634_cov20-Prasinocladus_malaysianus.AAC.1